MLSNLLTSGYSDASNLLNSLETTPSNLFGSSSYQGLRQSWRGGAYSIKNKPSVVVEQNINRHHLDQTSIDTPVYLHIWTFGLRYGKVSGNLRVRV